MAESKPIPMTRARLYVLIDAFERDIRAILARFVLPEMSESEALGRLYDKALSRRNEDDAATDSTPLTEYLDLREAYDLLNTHRELLPQELSREVRELTANLDRLVAIRKRVMHPRPLLAGDSDAALSLLNQFQTRFWPELKRMLAQLDEDPSWEPLISLKESSDLTLHNLPLPDYDETGLVGRGKEVSDVLKLIERRRESVITITGEGGIGKTSVALDVAYHLVDDASQPFEAILWTSLKQERLTASGIREISGAARDITGAVRPLGRALDSGFQGSLDELAEALQGLNALIVFDNLETVGGLDFSQVYETLPDSVTYLVTSRIGVGEYERRYPLSPLPEKDSLRLFNDFLRARRLHSLMRLTNETRLEVIRRLRYSPLAIRWFILAVEAGNDPLSLIRHQEELLEFCVRSVYDSLSVPAKEVLSALSVLGRPVASDELVVLLDKSTDEVNIGLQDLIRGSLVRRDASGVPGDLVLRVTLTETATQFLNKLVAFDRSLAALISERDAEYRRNEERRLADAASRSLAPIVVRTSGPHDIPTAQILRKALLASRDGDYESAYHDIETARRLNPDLWEVDRVEGFVRAATGEYAAASMCYESAYQKADKEGRAVVAHFYAGHLARNMKDLARAVHYEREAHEVLAGDETAMALGNYLVWSHKFEEGIRLIEPASNSLNGRAKLIAISALAEAYRRWAENARSQERNPILQYRRARQGLSIAIAALEAGISDRRLVAIASDCAATAVHGAAAAAADSATISDLSSWVDDLTKVLARFTGTKAWPTLVAAIVKLRSSDAVSAAVQRLYRRAAELDREAAQGFDSHSGDRLYGEVVSFHNSYGFIRHPLFPDNIFFHVSDINEDANEKYLSAGARVSFNVEETDRGPRARDVLREA
ncbi:MAG TPA: cold shock domain-containing protein [Streptosporangiaceae bacterium]|jgi:cold shock CspA family protein|nr:cold shock domain-containing protein [Streptosporangiaceae bacterium]